MADVIFKFYKVGGFVRDKFLGIKSKDIDYAVVLNNYSGDIDTAYQLLVLYLE